MSSGFSPMTLLESGAVEMVTQRCSIEVAGGARWGDGSKHGDERLELGWVQCIMGVLLSRLL
jgi:hypothetical protein